MRAEELSKSIVLLTGPQSFDRGAQPNCKLRAGLAYLPTKLVIA
jgi:hypothetical protein